MERNIPINLFGKSLVYFHAYHVELAEWVELTEKGEENNAV